MFREKLPSSVLRSIVDRVDADLADAKRRHSLADLQARVRDTESARDFAGSISSKFGLIGEIKAKSPSMGPMKHRDVGVIADVYGQSPAVTAISVLTNGPDFGMSLADLQRVRRTATKPILRKDFIFDPYQVWEARAYGADAILLMANVVTCEGLLELSSIAESLGMAVLFESHEHKDIEKLPANAKVCGINSRRFMAGRGKSTRGAYVMSRALRLVGFRWDLSIDREHFELVGALPKGAIKVAESGIRPSMIGYLRDHLHFDSLLVGTSILMSDATVSAALHRFEREIESSQLSLPLQPEPGLQHV